jgi:hypothetical protein
MIPEPSRLAARSAHGTTIPRSRPALGQTSGKPGGFGPAHRLMKPAENPQVSVLRPPPSDLRARTSALRHAVRQLEQALAQAQRGAADDVAAVADSLSTRWLQAPQQPNDHSSAPAQRHAALARSAYTACSVAEALPAAGRGIVCQSESKKPQGLEQENTRSESQIIRHDDVRGARGADVAAQRSVYQPSLTRAARDGATIAPTSR